MSQVTNRYHQTFEDIRQYSEEDREFWSARDLLPVFEYSSWDKFKAVIRKAIKSCDNSDIPSADHFSHVGKKVTIGSGAERHIPDYDYHLSRYACYLIVKNYLSDYELKQMQRIVSAYLDMAEMQAMRKIPMTMTDWEERLSGFLKLWDREILQDAGKVSAELAKAHAESEFEKYRSIQDRLFESDFDKATKAIENQISSGGGDA